MCHYTWREGLINAGLGVLHEDRGGYLWIGAATGLSCFKDGHFITNWLTRHFAGQAVRDIAEEESGTLWFATPEGLGRWRQGEFSAFTTADGLSDNAVAALYLDRSNTLWIGTGGGGLDRLQNDRFQSYTTRQGLFSDEIFGIIEDGQGWLWMSCSRGIFRVRKSDFDDLDRGTIAAVASVVYGKSDGMESPQCNGTAKPSCWKSHDGRLWFPTSKGLVTVDPRTVKVVPVPPPVFIETVTADARTIEDGRTRLAGETSS